MEWNVALDPCAIVCLLRSAVHVNIYPCADSEGPFSVSTGNTYYRLTNLSFIRDMAPQLRRYLKFALGRLCRCDFLRAMDYDWECDPADQRLSQPHNVWETQVWMQASGRVLARLPNSPWRIVQPTELTAVHQIVEDSLLPCTVDVYDDGRYWLNALPTDQALSATKWFYQRPDPLSQQLAFSEALPALYLSFRRDSIP